MLDVYYTFLIRFSFTRRIASIFFSSLLKQVFFFCWVEGVPLGYFCSMWSLVGTHFQEKPFSTNRLSDWRSLGFVYRTLIWQMIYKCCEKGLLVEKMLVTGFVCFVGMVCSFWWDWFCGTISSGHGFIFFQCYHLINIGQSASFNLNSFSMSALYLSSWLVLVIVDALCITHKYNLFFGQRFFLLSSLWE